MKNNYLHKVSKSILLQETIELRQILDLIYNSKDKVNNNEIYIGLIPIISSICHGWFEIFKDEVVHINILKIGRYNFDTLIKSSRIGLKLYSDKKISKASKRLHEISVEFNKILQAEYNDIQKRFVYLFGQCDFGVYTINDLPYGNTIQQSLYLSDVINFEAYNSLEVWEKEVQEVVFEFSKSLAQFINSIIELSGKSCLINKTSEIKLIDLKLAYNDYFLIDEKRRNILKGDLPIEIQLQLFNILCQNNFIINVLPLVFQSDGLLYHRSRLQTYIVSINTIKKIINKLPNEKYKKQLKEIVEVKEIYFDKDSVLRNNIFHYKIEGVDDSIFSISEKYFYEFIEFNSRVEFNDFMKVISEEIIKINKVIYKMVEFC
ncbi:Uncharacterised protein [Streptococcus gordonii]|uniref:hypothetical protein n=1 Tax=Streptococcus gordonii TaxID=1302 RepID=UPI000779B358|nr:hypothetical protein [Streptococcus gordonii]VTS97644.1 Uncharacterised protein [Streptococcus gordonii]